jgi:hypothetical protein
MRKKKMSETYHVEFEVTVKENQYEWRDLGNYIADYTPQGESKSVMIIPREFAEHLDPGNVLLALFQSAVMDFKLKQIQKTLQNEDTDESDSSTTAKE